MSTKKSFLLVLRFIFLLFSFHFLNDAFYKWDGYSYYMRFMDFLPSLSLSFLLWSIIGIIFAVAIWLLLSGLCKIIPKSLIPIRFEHILFVSLLLFLPIYLKKSYISEFSFSELFGLSRAVVLLIGFILSVIIIWIAGRYSERIIIGIDRHITPLVWLFAFMLVLAVPFAYLSREEVEPAYSFQESEDTVSGGLSRPNIILIVIDTLTASDMQLYGYDRPTTPFISEWAEDATVFNRAYASSNWTTPAMMSIMTGQRLWTHGVWHLIYYHPLDNYTNHLPASLMEAGYDVFSFVQNPSAHPDTLGIMDAFMVRDKSHDFWLKSSWWVDRLKSQFLYDPIVKEWIFEMNPIAKRINSFRPPVKTTIVPSDLVYDGFIELLSERQASKGKEASPYFAWLQVFPPHDYYLPPEPYMGMFGDSGRYTTDVEQAGAGLGYTYAHERQDEVDILRKRYDEFIVYSDKEFERFMSRLSDTVDLSNTIIILTSDHGESFSHGWLAHRGPQLTEPLVHVPLIVKMPGETEGAVSDMLVEHTDLAPTILELAGLPVPEWVEGRSLLPLLNDRDMQHQPVYSMQFSNTRIVGNSPIESGTIAVWDGDYKLVYYLEDKKKVLYDLRIDPKEEKNLFNNKPEIAERMSKLIQDRLDRANEKIALH